MVIALIIIAVVAILILLVASTKPKTFRVERCQVVGRPPEDIVKFVQNFHEWPKWSPWEKHDPAMKRSYSGSSDGEGAIYEWDGNSKAGAGRMEITQVVWPEKVVFRLDFIRPFRCSNTVEIRFEKRGGTTNVVWAMFGPNSFLSKVMSVFMSMDKLIGKDFEVGLRNIKSLSEGQTSA